MREKNDHLLRNKTQHKHNMEDPVLTMLRSLGPAIIQRENAAFEERLGVLVNAQYAKLKMSDIVDTLKTQVEKDPYTRYVTSDAVIDISELFTTPFHYSFNGMGLKSIRYSSESVIHVTEFMQYLWTLEPNVKTILEDLRSHFPGANVSATIHIDPPGKDIRLRAARILLSVHYKL